MGILQNWTYPQPEDVSGPARHFPQLAATAVCIAVLSALYLLASGDPHGLTKIPTINRSDIFEAYRTGVYWRLFLPKFLPKNGQPFRIWVGTFQAWIYILPTQYLEVIKNKGVSELSLRAVVARSSMSEFSSGPFDTFEIQVASKLVNGNLTGIKPVVQERTDQILEREIGTTGSGE
ncbi:hypothetical protein BJX99DRAFT_253299 [Aspergillus californicus]